MGYSAPNFNPTEVMPDGQSIDVHPQTTKENGRVLCTSFALNFIIVFPTKIMAFSDWVENLRNTTK